MTVAEIQKIALDRGMKLQSKKQTKKDLIRAIQRDEGSLECYATQQSELCGQENCLWRKDCSKDDKRNLKR
ncbi:MAG: SAP domain-containing protein [SAR324 cluster bacterium]|nr:SAP domain-containing protein [SAR324 cluster bacterium]